MVILSLIDMLEKDDKKMIAISWQFKVKCESCRNSLVGYKEAITRAAEGLGPGLTHKSTQSPRRFESQLRQICYAESGRRLGKNKTLTSDRGTSGA